jgi:hypothetical protein
MTSSITPGRQYRAMIDGRECVLETICSHDGGQNWLCARVESTNTDEGILVPADELRPRNVQRRKWNRTLPTDAKVLVEIHKNKTVSAMIADESRGGLCLVFDQDPQLVIGATIRVWYRHAPLVAVVRWAEESSGEYQVGVRWKTALTDR